MIYFTLENFLIYFCLAWGTNIALNFLYVMKRYIPGFSSLDYPLDCRIKYRGERLIGESTTFIGLFLCLVISVIIFLIIHSVVWALIPLIVYFGHMIGSFIKRRFHKKGGEFLPLIDHGDYMLLLGIIFVASGYINFYFAFTALLITYILHPLACFIAFKLKLREYPY